MMVISDSLDNTDTAQEIKFCIRDFFSKCDQIRSFEFEPKFRT